MYKVIARRWRPHGLKELVGQEHIGQALEQCLKKNRIPHAMLFSGPRGTGKTSAARILAQSLRCLQPIGVRACLKCTECLQISRSAGLDVLEIDGASHNGVEAVRELRQSVTARAAAGKWKIYIIDEVHMLTGAAFNALLKTLEEPPPHVLFVLATTEAHKLPSTVLSRCVRFNFRRISAQKILSHLQHICKTDKLLLSQEALWPIVRVADGSMRDAQSALEQVVGFLGSNQSLSPEQVMSALGVVDVKLVLRAVEALLKQDPQEAFKVSQQVQELGLEPALFVSELLGQIRNLLLAKELGTKELNHIAQDPCIQVPQELLEQTSTQSLHVLFDMGFKGAQDLAQSAGGHHVLEVLMLRLARAPKFGHLGTWLSKAELALKSLHVPHASAAAPLLKNNVERSTESKTEPQASCASELSAAKVPLAKNFKNWCDFVSKLSKAAPKLGAGLKHVYWLGDRGDYLHLGVPQDNTFLLHALKGQEALKIKKFLKQFWGKDYQIKLSSTAVQEHLPSVHNEKMRLQKELRARIKADPLVQKVERILEAQLVDIKETHKGDTL